MAKYLKLLVEANSDSDKRPEQQQQQQKKNEPVALDRKVNESFQK